MSSERIALWAPIPKPSSRLARYRVLSPHAGVHVSPLQLGAMTIGDKWDKFGIGGMDQTSSFKLLDAFYESGGNFIDTANNYQDQKSEEIIGEWAEERGIRDQLVIATKRGNDCHSPKGNIYRQLTSSQCTSALRASLKKLRTSYIDILYVHWWDWDTSVEEVMNGLHILVQQGKVLYLGISDSPAWVVSKANQYARDHGKTPFVIYQGAWNVMLRDFERDIIPMARSEGRSMLFLAVLRLPLGTSLPGGKLRSDEEEGAPPADGRERPHASTTPNWERNETERAMSTALEKVAKEKTPYVFPIIGGRKVEHLEANLESLTISLTTEHVKYLESIVPFDPGFPSTFIGDGKQYNHLLSHTAYVEKQPQGQPIVPDVD
ncbi:NADP-dependent oxidoreductase domain-containing protein [Suillus subalutaceus]|uniref:NADP-dependent oxidoreductase domain-containing protein n=1 Tax=Suillus subalutaceus TaxID=48586 RepID=UPI001B880B48|nr:NADP-dependent oxidoreductase domain-containing protein [Suillus subalutaceus]KAG1872391.1 NADP-dependent oxidoreductase domain-containing protein [Suillus subalutaceus]